MANPKTWDDLTDNQKFYTGAGGIMAVVAGCTLVLTPMVMGTIPPIIGWTVFTDIAFAIPVLALGIHPIVSSYARHVWDKWQGESEDVINETSPITTAITPKFPELTEKQKEIEAQNLNKTSNNEQLIQVISTSPQ